MIKRIESIKSVGLFNEANGKPFAFQRATLIYAENGRGKSTLASILRSLSVGDSAAVLKRKTIDATAQPEIDVQFENGHKVSFKSGVWSEVHPELLIFDSDFVDLNVHSGGVVNTGHRKNLLEFALGDGAVLARKAVDNASISASDASGRAKSIENKLSGFHQGLSLNDFEKLQKITDPDVEIAIIQKRLVAAANIAAIGKKPIPKGIEIPTLNFDRLFGILKTSLVDIEKDAETTVKQHLQKIGTSGAESWLSEGQQFDNRSACPYCGQSTEGIQLIASYKTHFNLAYAELKKKVSQLEDGVARKTDTQLLDSFVRDLNAVNEAIEGWSDHVKLPLIMFYEAPTRATLEQLAKLLKDLAASKVAAVLESIGSDAEKQAGEAIWCEFIAPLEKVNQEIEAVSKSLNEFRTKLNGENSQQLQAEIKRIEMAKVRHTVEVVEQLRLLGLARAEIQKFEKLKKDSREALNGLMKTTLSRYEGEINALLLKFGASFAIEKLDANYRGGAPRSEYGIKLRGKSVELDGQGVSFGTALSEGDKRTLAFAFFVASTLANPSLSAKIVVIDDPMCSLDSNRRNQTKLVIKRIYEGAKQSIVLAHDAYFLRTVREALTPSDGSAPPVVFQLRFAPQGYTDFAVIELDKECESVYYKHHRTVADYVAGHTSDDQLVSKSIRPMLEGYLHRRFPGLIPKNLMFGHVLTFVNDVAKPHPVEAVLPFVGELGEINGYVGQFHHDTNPDADKVVIVSTELRAYATRALDLVYKGAV